MDPIGIDLANQSRKLKLFPSDCPFSQTGPLLQVDIDAILVPVPPVWPVRSKDPERPRSITCFKRRHGSCDSQSSFLPSCGRKNIYDHVHFQSKISIYTHIHAIYVIFFLYKFDHIPPTSLCSKFQPIWSYLRKGNWLGPTLTSSSST